VIPAKGKGSGWLVLMSMPSVRYFRLNSSTVVFGKTREVLSHLESAGQLFAQVIFERFLVVSGHVFVLGFPGAGFSCFLTLSIQSFRLTAAAGTRRCPLTTEDERLWLSRLAPQLCTK
jgi:hypothetical protein